jgi:hypothetical protein
LQGAARVRIRAVFPVLLILSCAAYGLDAKAPASGIMAADTDSNGDGLVDYIVYFLRSGQKEHEELDYDRDGKMDDFLYYSEGLAVREEIDSDFDGKIDIWVYLTDGKYIKRYERDLDGDGKPDFVKDYDTK